MSARRRKRQARGSAAAPVVTPASPPLSLARATFSGWALWASLALIAATVIVYASVRHHEFVNWDDPEYVSANPHVAGGLTGPSVSWAFTTGHAANWHPLTWLSHMLDVQLYGMDAGRHHITNLALHIANTLLLFGLLHRMTGARGRSAFVAGLFALHPLHVESVAWVAERKDVLSTLFWMLTLWGYSAYVSEPRRGRYLAVLLLYASGLMAKPMLVTVPFVLLLIDYWPLGRVALGADPPGLSEWAGPKGQWSVGLRLVREKLPLLALALASSVVTFLVQQQGGAVAGLDALPLDRRVGNAPVSYVAYVGKMLWPTRLAVVYPYPPSLSGWWVAATTLGLIGVTAVVIRKARRYPYLPVGWLWYVGTLVPVIGLIQVGSQPMADRYTYVPLIGLFIMVSWGVPDLLSRRPYRKIALASAVALVLLACTITAWGQVQHWKNNIALWGHALEVTTGNHRAHNNLGNARADEGRVGEAIAHYSEALRLRPGFAEAHNNLGNALAGQGKIGEAIAHYSEALRLRPDDPLAHNGLGSALDDQGKVSEAITHYAEALRIKPDFAEAHNNLGAALAKQGRIDEAIREFSEALRIKPDAPDYHYNLAVLFDRKAQFTEAVRHFEMALSLDPRHQAARRALEDLTRRRKGAEPEAR